MELHCKKNQRIKIECHAQVEPVRSAENGNREGFLSQKDELWNRKKAQDDMWAWFVGKGRGQCEIPEAGGRWEPPRNNSRFDCLRESRAKLDPGSD